MNEWSPPTIIICIDSEFHNRDVLTLQVVVYFKGRQITKHIFVCDRERSELLERENKSFFKKHSIKVQFVKFGDDINVVDTYLRHIVETRIPEAIHPRSGVSVSVYFFYSPKDLEFAFGFNNIKNLFCKYRPKGKSPFLLQHRAIYGKITTQPTLESPFKVNYKMHDLAGWSQGKLSKLAASVDVPMESKSSLDDYKTNIRVMVS